MWVMGRFTWILSRMYNTLEARDEWLELSKHGADFIKKYGFDDDGRMFFIVDRDGRPIRKRRYLFTETFAVIALAEYARATRDRKTLRLAQETMKMVLDYYNNPEGLDPKYIPENYSVKGHSMAMIRINTLQILRDAAEALEESNDIFSLDEYDTVIDDAINEVFSHFVKPDKKALVETVGPQGEYLGHLPEGRCINPGHAIETGWFVMEEGKRRNDEELIQKALPLLEWSYDWGWDSQYGGLFSFVDVEKRQPTQLEWDMKLWWPQNEAIYAFLLAHQLTGEEKYLELFNMVHEWCLKHYPDTKHNEWIGYLHRDGSVALDLKGNYFKGPFHLPRQQLYSHLLLKEMVERS
jgi:N-acylglucosamine 2-epimerase